jgi:hypothetical protein
MSQRQQREKARRRGAEGAPVMAQDAQDDDDGYGRWRRCWLVAQDGAVVAAWDSKVAAALGSGTR